LRRNMSASQGTAASAASYAAIDEA
jgi:hypothetical protein